MHLTEFLHCHLGIEVTSTNCGSELLENSFALVPIPDTHTHVGHGTTYSWSLDDRSFPLDNMLLWRVDSVALCWGPFPPQNPPFPQVSSPKSPIIFQLGFGIPIPYPGTMWGVLVGMQENNRVKHLEERINQWTKDYWVVCSSGHIVNRNQRKFCWDEKTSTLNNFHVHSWKASGLKVDIVLLSFLFIPETYFRFFPPLVELSHSDLDGSG